MRFVRLRSTNFEEDEMLGKIFMFLSFSVAPALLVGYFCFREHFFGLSWSIALLGSLAAALTQGFFIKLLGPPAEVITINRTIAAVCGLLLVGLMIHSGLN